MEEEGGYHSNLAGCHDLLQDVHQKRYETNNQVKLWFKRRFIYHMNSFQAKGSLPDQPTKAVRAGN